MKRIVWISLFIRPSGVFGTSTCYVSPQIRFLREKDYAKPLSTVIYPVKLLFLDGVFFCLSVVVGLEHLIKVVYPLINRMFLLFLFNILRVTKWYVDEK